MKTIKPRRAERESIDKIFRPIREEWGFAPSFGLPELVRCWQMFVGENENGYQLSIYDYTHDLAMRDLLEQVRLQAPPRLAQELGMELDLLDERFRRASRPSSRPIAEPMEEPAGEWWFRIPNQAGKDIQSHIMERGLKSE